MRGIIAYGAYVPYFRLQRSAIGATLGQPGGRGTRSVASYDEDATTMAVEAGRRLLRSTDVEPSALAFSTATPPYLDKTNATAIHAALRLPSNVPAFDMVGSARSGVGALLGACTSGGTSLVTAADMRTGLPGSADERDGGDGAAALLVGGDHDGPVIAEFVGSGSATGEFLDRWRTPGSPASKVWEERFGEHAYLPLVEQAMKSAFESSGVDPASVDQVLLTGLSARAVRGSGRVVGQLGEVVEDLSAVIGNTGTAHPGLLLASVLDRAEPGQTIALVVLADGCDVLVFRTTEAVASYTSADPVADQIAAGNDGLDYPLFLTWRGMLDREPPRRPDPDRPAAPPAARMEDWKYAFVGSKDRSSGAIHLPPRRVSYEGGAVDEMEPIPMADVPATIVTFTVDRLAFSLSPPVVAAVIDFDGGGRFQCEVTDVDPETVKIGDRVEMTFRRLFTADGVHNYFWKARPSSGTAPAG
ncbi:MAG: OB-fold domain-containing protein [Actinomycetota bacterium]